MNKKLVSLLVISFFALTLVLSATPAKAEQGEWITNYTIKYLDTQATIKTGINGVVTGTDLLQGSKVQVDMTITVPITVPDSTITLSTNLQKAAGKDVYWALITADYPVQNYNPNTQTVTFSQAKGSLVITCYGTIPSGLTTSTSSTGTGQEIHLPNAFTLITLTGPNSQQLDQIKPWVIDEKIQQYYGLNSQANNTYSQLQIDGAAPAYLQLYNNVMQGAASQQLVVNEPPPVEATASMMDTLFIPVAGALAAVAVIGIVLFFRAKGKAGYVSQVVEDQIRDLEGLTLRASKVDRSLSAGLETIEERLKRAVGA
jgi:preprotein translocase subunit SecG